MNSERTKTAVADLSSDEKTTVFMRKKKKRENEVFIYTCSQVVILYRSFLHLPKE